MGKESEKSYLWVSVFFCGLTLKIYHACQERFLVQKFSISRAEMCGKESETLLFVSESLFVCWR